MGFDCNGGNDSDATNLVAFSWWVGARCFFSVFLLQPLFFFVRKGWFSSNKRIYDGVNFHYDHLFVFLIPILKESYHGIFII